MKSIFLLPSSAHLFTAIGNSDAHKIFPIPSPFYYSFYLPVTITFHSSFGLLTLHFTPFYWPSQNLHPIMRMLLIRLLLFKNRSYFIPSSGKTNNSRFYLKFHPWKWMKLWEEKKLWCIIFIFPGFISPSYLAAAFCVLLRTQLFPDKL